MGRECDVCIVGGGPSGSVLAARLAQLGHSVLVLERARFPRRHLGESLTPGVIPMLDSIGARGVIEAAGGRPVRKVRVLWDQGLQIREDPREEGRIVDRAHLDAALLAHAVSLGVQVIQPGQWTSRRWTGNAWHLTVSTGDGVLPVRARFLADASGRARTLGGDRRELGRPTLALYAYWQGDRLPAEPCMEAGVDAWYWGVPLPDGTFNTLVFVDQEQFRADTGTTVAGRFLRWIEGSRLLEECRGAELLGTVGIADATASIAEPVVTARSIRVGDAAMAIDPLSSSGVQKAIQSALSGAVVVNTLLRRPQDRMAAIQFHTESVESAARRHQAWAGRHYAAVAAHQDHPFWTQRAATGPSDPEPGAPRPLPDPDTRLCPSPDLSFTPQPVLGGEFVRMGTAVRHPDWDGPVAYLGGLELAPLLCDIPAGIRARDVAAWIVPRVGAPSAPNVAEWLITRGALVPAGSTRPVRAVQP